MSKLRISGIKTFTAVALTAALVGAAYAGPGRGGGGGFHGGGGGGAPHAMGGGGHFGGGGMRMGGGAPHFGGGGGGPHFGGAHFGGPRFGGSPAISHFAARPAFHGQRSFAVQGNRFTGHGPGLNANRGARFNANRNAAAFNPARNA